MSPETQKTQKNVIQKSAYFNHVRKKWGGCTKHTYFGKPTFAQVFTKTDPRPLSWWDF